MIKKDKGFLFTNLELIKQTSPNADKLIKEIIGDIIKLLTETLGRIDMKYGIGAAFDRLIASTAQIIAAQPLD